MLSHCCDASSCFGYPLTTAAVAGAGLAYAIWEARQFRLRRVDVPVLESGEEPLRILHVSDLHLVPGQRVKERTGWEVSQPFGPISSSTPATISLTWTPSLRRSTP